MIMTLDELKTAKDGEVLASLDEFKTLNVTTADFQSATGAQYSYTSLTSELTKRGYSQQWVKSKNEKSRKEMKVKMSKDNDRMNLNMTKDCKEKYEKFLKGQSYNFVHTTAAIMTYLDMVENGEIKVLVEVV